MVFYKIITFQYSSSFFFFYANILLYFVIIRIVKPMRNTEMIYVPNRILYVVQIERKTNNYLSVLLKIVFSFLLCSFLVKSQRIELTTMRITRIQTSIKSERADGCFEITSDPLHSKPEILYRYFFYFLLAYV